MGSSPNKRPNVVLFVHDSWRWDVMGHMGNPAAQTPGPRPPRRDGRRFLFFGVLPESGLRPESLFLHDGLVYARTRAPGYGIRPRVG